VNGAGAAAEYILRAVRERGTRTFRQAPRRPALECPEGEPALRVFAEHKLRGVPELAVSGLWHWARGFPAEIATRVPGPDHVLELQARGRRVVSLLRPELAPNGDGLSFAVHDLCHLAKFAGPHYREQVGFFRTLFQAFRSTCWAAAEAGLDAGWLADRGAVSADMNGSSVFLFAVLKMKLKMAARRQLARREGREPPSGGKFSASEQAVFDELSAALLESMRLPPAVRAAALSTSARRDAPEQAGVLARYFEDLGGAIVAPILKA